MRALSFVADSLRRPALLIGAVVFLALLPLLPSLANYHGDECFYTDAALRMLQSGDYLTPYAANGALRFARPILPYWAVLVGYYPLGINFFSSRLFFLLAGCGVIVLTYQLALALFEQGREALLATLILASNVQVLTISIRSTPDVLLCLFVLMSLLGFARLMIRGDRSWRNYVLAYLGAGLAVETRGLPGFGVALFAILYWAIFRPGQLRLRHLFEWKTVCAGLVIALAWFGAMLWLHGGALLEDFYYDQISDNVREYHSFAIVRNLLAYPIDVVRHFLPWAALLGLGFLTAPQKGMAFWREHRTQAWFVLGWFLFILAPCTIGGYDRTAYMVLAYPALAVLAAGFLNAFATDVQWTRWTRLILRMVALLCAVVGLTLVAAGVQIHPRILLAGVLWFGTASLVWLGVRRDHSLRLWLSIGALAFMPFWGTELLMRPVFSESPALAIVDRLVPERLSRRKVYAINLSRSYQAQLRVLSGGKLSVTPLTVDSEHDVPPNPEPFILGDADKRLFQGRPGELEQVGYAGGKWRAGDFLELFRPSPKEAVFARNRTPFYIFFPAKASNSNP